VKRAIGALYSWSAERLYEPVVLKGAFRLFGGRLNQLVADQGGRAAAAAVGHPILDVPSGTGYFGAGVAHLHDGLLVAVDYAWGMAVQTQRTALLEATPNLAAVRADVHHLPFADGCFGAVLCTNGLQVIPGLDRSVAELARVTAPGGVLLVSVLTAPLGAVLPRGIAGSLPAVLRSGRGIADAISATGLMVTALRRERLAHLIEAVKIT
jgi:SAM-dependent methyltransferase